MPSTHAERTALLADVLQAIPLFVTDALEAPDTEHAYAALADLADHYDTLMAVVAVLVAENGNIAALARAGGISRQAMHERIARARLTVDDAAAQYAT
jgi:transcriptional regulator of acetoin/glycerol metabolism